MTGWMFYIFGIGLWRFRGLLFGDWHCWVRLREAGGFLALRYPRHSFSGHMGRDGFPAGFIVGLLVPVTRQEELEGRRQAGRAPALHTISIGG
jgi:hypothetical protein